MIDHFILDGRNLSGGEAVRYLRENGFAFYEARQYLQLLPVISSISQPALYNEAVQRKRDIRLL